ncbi:MAG TPA: cytochrome bc complex cytochrome b subunit [Euzebyales bacterium]
MTDHTTTPLGRLAQWIDQRVGAAKFTRSTLDYVFPKHFTFLFGEIALYSFVVLVGTGIFLALFYTPSEAEVIYAGTYEPLRGVAMTEAYESVVDLSFSVRAGLLFRQTHHWAALVFLGAIFIHLCRVFFTGAFRRPRELNWITGVTLMIVAIAEGFAGYSLLDDLLSGTGVRIGYSIAESIPVVGTWLAYWVWGGEYPGEGFLSRLFAVHIFLMPALIAALIGVHLFLVARPHHTQFPGGGRREDNVVGLRLWPSYATLSVGLFFLVAAVLHLMGGFLQINPVWLYGPYDVFAVSSGSQADWYFLWLQGALRLMPGVSLELGPWTVANQFFPAVLYPGVVFAVLYLWPFLEARVTGDRGEHHLLDRPRDRPVRTALGAAAIAGFVVLLVAGSDDVFVTTFDWSIVPVRNIERVAFFVLPALVGLAVWKAARDLSRAAPLDRTAPPTRSPEPMPANIAPAASGAAAATVRTAPRRDSPGGHDVGRPTAIVGAVATVGAVVALGSLVRRALRRHSS